MKKIRSFTIIELMITLIISAITISIGYYAYFLFNRQFEAYRLRTSQMKQYFLLQTALQHDFEKASHITDTLEKTALIISRGDTRISYFITENSIVRRSPGSVDSFQLKTTIKEVQYMNDTLRLIQTILLEAQVNRDPVLLTVDKIYSSQQLMRAQKIDND